MDQTPSKTCIVAYSRTGHSRRIAGKLAKALNATMIKLNAPSFEGPLGYMRAALKSLKQSCELAPQDFTSLADYNRIVVCGPVWTSYPATPLRGLLKSDITLPQSVSLFLTRAGSAPATKAFDVAQADLRRPLMAVASLGNRQEGTPEEDRIIETFLQKLRVTHSADHDERRLHAL